MKFYVGKLYVVESPDGDAIEEGCVIEIVKKFGERSSTCQYEIVKKNSHPWVDICANKRMSFGIGSEFSKWLKPISCNIM